MPARWRRVAEAPVSWATNVQAAVETKHHLIITHEVTIVGTDRS